MPTSKRFYINGDFQKMKQDIADYKKLIRTVYPNVIVRFRSRGRGPRKSVFAQTGRRYSEISPNTNDVYIRQPEAPFMTYFTVYTYIKGVRN